MIVYGKQIVLHILEKHSQLIKEIYLTKDIDQKLFNKFNKLGLKIIRLDEKKAQAMAQGGNHQGFLLQIDEFAFSDLNILKNKPFLVFLDEITDVGNIGAIIRSSYALGVDGVLISGLNEIKMQNIIRSSSGAALELPIVHIKSPLDAINELKMSEFDLICADIHGKDLKTHEKSAKKKVLILGSENKGVNKKIQERSNVKVKIEMKNNFDSLNVSAAAAILIYGLI